MRAFRLTYDGADYYGYQRQPAVPTVEDALFDALRALDVLDPDREKPDGYAAAGRTDAGVSALAQTVAFEAPDWLAPRALNAELPPDVRAWAAAEAPDEFHATHDAVERRYVYHLYAPTNDAAAPVTGSDWPSVSEKRIHEACRALSGSHDYHNLTPDDRGTARTLSLAAERDGDFLALSARAGGFPRQLVRRLVTLVQRVGSGEASVKTVERVLAPEALPGHEGLPPAAPEPLVMADVTYPALEFIVDERAAASAREVFERSRIERAVGSKVASQLRDGVR